MAALLIIQRNNENAYGGLLCTFIFTGFETWQGRSCPPPRSLFKLCFPSLFPISPVTLQSEQTPRRTFALARSRERSEVQLDPDLASALLYPAPG